MVNQSVTMQSDELDLKGPLRVSTSLTDMTFADITTPSPRLEPQTTLDDKSLLDFDPVKLEADIELEVSSDGSPSPDDSIRDWLQRITQMQSEIQKKIEDPVGVQNPGASRVVKYQDLPYMGEMTLDNSKPRRGRKPKKADICHLIYKNYGTIFPGTPNARSLVEKEGGRKEVGRSDVQNKIISSLLERRLTQDGKSCGKKENKRKVCKGFKEQDQSEPLNLCIRDLNQLKIRLMENGVKSEVLSEEEDDDVEFVQDTTASTSTGNNGEDYVYWPNAGIFIHPLALQQQLMYYQRLAASNNYTLPRPPSKPSPELRKLAPKHRTKKTSDDSEQSSSAKRSINSNPEKTPPKRKRSAIFIPPIPPENQTNPATEVSICKFKFTGGAKPSLQEKKMLSVDSGGNFRYYSGTGDKSMRGYEFFPRETLQQQIGQQGSSTGAFLQASGEKIYPAPPLDFPGKSGDFLLSPEISPSHHQQQQPQPVQHKKRRSRKSLQREKLEQTFKEKGFLIQTQQLESAEGATYCKFRQLRKFTRYLFRSWKDYLPGNVKELQDGEEDVERESLSRESECFATGSDVTER